jgi:hypothetical protein
VADRRSAAGSAATARCRASPKAEIDSTASRTAMSKWPPSTRFPVISSSQALATYAPMTGRTVRIAIPTTISMTPTAPMKTEGDTGSTCVANGLR